MQSSQEFIVVEPSEVAVVDAAYLQILRKRI
jgi:hypothetical protein